MVHQNIRQGHCHHLKPGPSKSGVGNMQPTGRTMTTTAAFAAQLRADEFQYQTKLPKPGGKQIKIPTRADLYAIMVWVFLICHIQSED